VSIALFPEETCTLPGAWAMLSLIIIITWELSGKYSLKGLKRD
jgi:hypothetical protein